MTEKERKQLRENRERMQSIKVEVRGIMDTIAKENRSMNDEESKQFAELNAEYDLLKLRSYEIEHPDVVQRSAEPEVSADDACGVIIRSMANGNGIPQQYDYLRSEDGGLLIPMAPIQRSENLQNAGTVAPITPVTIGDVIKALRPGEVIDQLGLKIQTMTGQWNFPVVAGATAEWNDENVEISDKKIDITKISPSPKRLAISVPVSNRAIYQTGGRIRSIVLEAINNAITTAFNVAMLTPKHDGESKAPKGALDGIEATKLSAAPTRQNVLDIMKKVYSTGVVRKNPVFVASSDMYYTLAATPVDAGSGMFLLDIATGTMLGCKVVMSDYVGKNTLAFGEWSYELLGMFGNASLTIDGQSAAVAKKNLTYFVLNVDADMLRLRDEAFAYLTVGEN